MTATLDNLDAIVDTANDLYCNPALLALPELSLVGGHISMAVFSLRLAKQMLETQSPPTQVPTEGNDTNNL
jgi:hypothetical protein